MTDKFVQGPFRRALKNRLESALSVPVVLQKQSEETEPTPPFVMVHTPESEARGDLKNDTGFELTQRIRIHTRYPKGKANLAEREEIAASVAGALEDSFSVSGHNILHLPTPNVIPQSYDAGGDKAYDLLLDYELKTQTM